MEEKNFAALYSALKELNDFKALEELNSIKESVDSGNYFVALIGQYSAGKSSLINNLLGRQILPGGRVETTPILTYLFQMLKARNISEKLKKFVRCLNQKVAT